MLPSLSSYLVYGASVRVASKSDIYDIHLFRFQLILVAWFMPSVMGSVDCGSQTGPEHWLFTSLTELSVLAPHFLPTGELKVYA